MSRYADPQRCPDCRSSLTVVPPPPACPGCELPLQGAAATELFATLQRADALVEQLRRTPPPAVAPVPSLAPMPRPAAPRPAAVAPPVRWSVPALLLGLGGLCLVVGALVFLAVAWSVLGVGGRTAVLVCLTAVAAVGVGSCAGRGLRAAAETFASVAGLFLVLDLAGAAGAGWLGDTGPVGLVLGSALLVLVVVAGGNALLRPLPTGVLIAPQVIATGAGLLAAGAGIVQYAEHLTTAIAATVLASVLLAEAARRTGQVVLAWGGASSALLLWLLLVVTGWLRVTDAWESGGPGTATWEDVQALLAAPAFAVALVVVSFARRLPAGPVQQVAAVAASWLVAGSAVAVLAGSVTDVVLVAVAAALASAGMGVLLRPLAPGLRVAAAGAALVASVEAATAVVALVEAVAGEVSRQLVAARPDLLATAHVGSPDVAAAWTLPLAALAVAVAAGLRDPRLLLALAAPVVAVTGLCYAPVLLLVVVAAVLLAALCVVLRLPALTGAWVVVAGSVAVYHPAPATAVALLVTVVVAAHVARSHSVLGQLALPALAAATAGSACWLLGVPGTVGAAVVIVVVGLVTVALCSDLAGHLSALTVCLVAGAVGVAAATSALDGWAAAYLSLTAAVAAAVAIRGGVREAAWVAAGLELLATWARLGGAGVDTPEAYTLPLAAVLLAFGGWTLWRDPEAGTLRTLGPGLATALVPTLLLAVADPVSLRSLLLAIACALLVAGGAALRSQAPLVLGAGAGAVLVVAELVPYHDAVPRWLLLTAAGACLVLAGVRWEYLASAGRRSWGRVAELR